MDGDRNLATVKRIHTVRDHRRKRRIRVCHQARITEDEMPPPSPSRADYRLTSDIPPIQIVPGTILRENHQDELSLESKQFPGIPAV
jgi:hypothetical protein